MIRGIFKVCLVSMFCVLLAQCKKNEGKDVPQIDVEQVEELDDATNEVKEDDVVDVNSIEGQFLNDPKSIEAKNIYEEMPFILELTAKSLKVKPEKLLEESKKDNKLFYSKNFDGYDLMYKIIQSSDLGYYLSDEFKAEVIKNNGKGVGMMFDVTPQVSNDSNKKFGNYYAITIYEDYPDRIAGAQHLFFDISTKKLFWDPIYEEVKELKYDKGLLEKGKPFL